MVGNDKYNILLSSLLSLKDDSQLLKADWPTSSMSLVWTFINNLFSKVSWSPLNLSILKLSKVLPLA